MNHGGPLAVVTGASGLLGSYIAQMLAGRGQHVRVLARQTSDLAFISTLDVEIRQGDLTDSQFCDEAIRDADVVYHCAGRITNWGPWHDFEQGNIVSTQNVSDACRRHRIRRLVHISSMAAYGHPRIGNQRLTEDAPLGQRLWSYDYYNRSKIAAEQIVAGLGEQATIVRPSWIYGPRDEAFIPRIIGKLRKRAVWVIGPKDRELNGVYVTDLAEGCIEAGDRESAAGHAYHLCSEEGITQQQLFDTLCEEFELPRVRRRVPLRVAYLAAHAMETVARLSGGKQPPSVTRHAISVLSRPAAQFSCLKARTDLGWQPRTNFQVGLERTIEWIKSGRPLV